MTQHTGMALGVENPTVLQARSYFQQALGWLVSEVFPAHKSLTTSTQEPGTELNNPPNISPKTNAMVCL